MTDLKLTYTDSSHAYFLNGKRAKGVTTVAKIPIDTYTLEQWAQRQVAIGLTIDRNLIEKVAVDVENRDAINRVCEDAKETAKAHLAADRGTQMHRVLELVLLDQEQKLLTDQQRRDADVLKRTLDRYKLTPFDGLTEQFVAWPHYTVCGRFDAILERADGGLVLVDLKSGPNAVLYPHSVSVQLALYARAPHVSDNIHARGDKCTVTDWRTMPQRLDRRSAYVLLVEPDAEIGTLHEINIEHGWAAAQLALQIVEWRKALDYGKKLVAEVDAETFAGSPAKPATWADVAAGTASIEDLRSLWRCVAERGEMTEDFRAAAQKRSRELIA